jgi:hypothetical protein
LKASHLPARTGAARGMCGLTKIVARRVTRVN